MTQAPNVLECKNVLEVLYHRDKFGGARISPAAVTATNVQFFCYRQHCAQRKPAGISFTQRPILRFFAPQGRHVAPIGVEPPKLKFLFRFDQNVEYKRPAGAYPLRDFHKICSVCTPFQDALGVKIWLDLLKGLWSYEGFKLRGYGFGKIQTTAIAVILVA